MYLFDCEGDLMCVNKCQPKGFVNIRSLFYICSINKYTFFFVRNNCIVLSSQYFCSRSPVLEPLKNCRENIQLISMHLTWISAYKSLILGQRIVIFRGCTYSPNKALQHFSPPHRSSQVSLPWWIFMLSSWRKSRMLICVLIFAQIF